MFLSSLSIKGRLLVSLIVGGIGMGVIIALSLFFQYNGLVEGKKLALKQNVETATSILAYYKNQAKDGNISEEAAKKAAMQTIKNLRYNGKEYFWINDMAPNMVMHPFKPALDGKDISSSKDPKGKALFVEMVQTVSKNGEGYVEYYWPKPGLEEPIAKLSFVKGFSDWGWIVGSGVYVDDVREQFITQTLRLVGLSAAVMLIMGAVTILILLTILKPIGSLGQMAAQMVSADADLTKRLDIKSTDEIGKACGNIDGFISIIQDTIKHTKNTAVQNASIAAELSATANHIGQKSEESSRIIASVTTESKHIHETISRSMIDSKKLQDELEASQKALQGAKAIVEQMTSSIHSNAQTEQEMAMSLEQLSSEADQVKSVLTIISDIADQTNLLALNAAIEAARAGEHGRGFAVVADEVRKLAERTQKSLAEINATINTIVQSINTASEKMAKNADAIAMLVTESNKVTQNISDSSETLDTAMELSNQTVSNNAIVGKESESISAKMESASHIISSNAVSTEEIAAAISHLHQLTESLSLELARFKA